MTQGQLTYWI